MRAVGTLALAVALAAGLASPGRAAPSKHHAEAPAAKAKTTVKARHSPSKSKSAADPDGATKAEARHTVLAGETLGGIANRAEVPRILIIEANGLKPPYGVREGQVLVIPRRRSHKVKPGETGFAIAMDYGVAWSAIAVANGIDPKTRVRAGQKLVIPTITKAPLEPADSDDEDAIPKRGDAPVRFAWPAPGEVRRGFVLRSKGASSSETRKTRTSPHDGIDIVGKKGDPVRAAAPGKVWFAGKEPNLYGNVVILDHGRGWFSAYAKLAKVTVKKGESVERGERIGLIGNTGSTSTTELHFEVRRKTVPIDPEDLLPPR